MKSSKLLEAGLDLIRDPENWTQGGMYEKVRRPGLRGWFQPRIDRYCSLGALFQVSDQSDAFAERHANRVLTRCMHGIISYNDTHTHAEVVAKWQEAIRQVKVEEAKIAEVSHSELIAA